MSMPRYIPEHPPARRARWRIACAGLGMVLLACGDAPVEPVGVFATDGLVGFEAQLDSIRFALRIPGMAAAIAQDDEIVWSRGFGYADVDEGRLASDTTSFHLASVTKPIAAIIVMQLVEQGVISLDDPIAQYGIDLPSAGTIYVRHLLDHTSEGAPGDVHRYDGMRHLELGNVILEATGRTLAELLVERVLQPLELRHTAPNVELLGDFLVTGFDRRAFYANMARPYELVDGQVIPLSHPRHFSASGGLLASVRVVAAISIALDQDRLLDRETKNLMLSPSVWIDADDGKSYGLGWYVQTYEGVTLEWHGGEWDAQSALLLRAPEKKLTFVAAANTRRMSGAYYMGRGDVMESGVARLFVESFVLDDKPLP